MNQKIIETNELYPDVLIYRNGNDGNLEHEVVIQAIGFNPDEGYDGYFEIESASFGTELVAQQFIKKNYSLEDAIQWLQTNNMWASEEKKKI